MKKLLFIATVAFAVAFSACNPMESINEDVEKAIKNADKDKLFLLDKVDAPASYTLTAEDYALSSNADVVKYKNFSKYALPSANLPEILNKKFSAADAQSMLVTYDYYESPYVDKDNAREIADAEYGEMGQRYSNFSNQDEAKDLIGKLLDRKVFANEAGTEKTVKYIMFSTNQTRYIKVNADGTAEAVGYTSSAVEVTDAIYEATGNGKYKNFYRIGDALEDLAKYATDNGTAPVTYSAKVYQNYIDTYTVYMYNGTNWTAKQSVMPRSEELSYKLDKADITNSTWKADPAIKITLTSDDYNLLPGAGDEGGTARYQNFDLRSGKIPGTDRGKLAQLIGQMLDTNYAAVADQQYLVSFAYYDGSNGVALIRIIKSGGTWSEVEE